MLIRNVSKTMKAILRVPNALTSLKILHRVFAEVLTTLTALPSLQAATIQMTTIFYSEPLFASTNDDRDCSNTKIFTEGSIGEEHSFWPITLEKIAQRTHLDSERRLLMNTPEGRTKDLKFGPVVAP